MCTSQKREGQRSWTLLANGALPVLVQALNLPLDSSAQEAALDVILIVLLPKPVACALSKGCLREVLSCPYYELYKGGARMLRPPVSSQF